MPVAAPATADDAAGWVVYEVGVEVDPDSAAEFDAWLAGHVQRILGLPGFLRADVYSREAVPEGVRRGWQRRVIQYRVRSQPDLDLYLARHAPEMRAEAIERFGERLHFDRRALQHRSAHEPARPEPARCLDCGAPVSGRHCAECGQRTRVRVLTLWSLLEEAFESLTHADSRVWRTFRALLLKPGILTSEYLEGRRTRYIPPFRLYLVVSIVYFLLAGLEGLFADPEEAFRIENNRGAAGLAEAREELAKEGIAVPPLAQDDPDPNPDSATVVSGFSDMDCAQIEIGGQTLTPAQQQRLAPICERIKQAGGQRFAKALFENVPKMMFVFLPLIAAVNLLFYPLRRHYYVVHLLFFVHFHAFVFLAFTITNLYEWIAGAIPWIGWTSGLLTFAMVIYIPVYLYKSMRRVFRQGRAWTLWKFALLSQAYVVCLLVTFLGLLVYTGVTL